MTQAVVRDVVDAADLVTASGDHPFARSDLSPAFLTTALHLVGTHAVAWTQHWADGRLGTILLGDPHDLASLVAAERTREWAGSVAPVHVTSPVESYEAVRIAFGLRGGNAWDRMWTTTPPPHIPAEAGVTWHDGSDEEIAEFVRTHNPQPHALPGQHPGQRWAVIHDGERLVACGCTEPGNTEAPLIGGIVVDRAQRGRGLGAAVTAYLTRDALTRTGACTLGVFADNDHARGLYERLGYRIALRARTGFPLRRPSREPSRGGR